MSIDPVSAGIQVGGSFLAQYMAQRAAEEQARRKAMVETELAKGENEQNYAQNQNKAFDMLMRGWGSALGR